MLHTGIQQRCCNITTKYVRTEHKQH